MAKFKEVNGPGCIHTRTPGSGSAPKMSYHTVSAISYHLSEKVAHTANPHISTSRLILKNELLLECLFEGRAYLKVAYFKVWNFPNRLTRKTTIF